MHIAISWNLVGARLTVSADSGWKERARWVCLHRGPTSRSWISKAPNAAPIDSFSAPNLTSEVAPEARTQMSGRSPSMLTIDSLSARLAAAGKSSYKHNSSVS